MTFRSVTNDELLEEIKTLKSTVDSLTRQLNQLNLRQQREQQEENTSTGELQVGQTVELLTKAKHGKSGDKAIVLHIGKTFVTVKLIATGGTTTRLPRNLKIVKK